MVLGTREQRMALSCRESVRARAQLLEGSAEIFGWELQLGSKVNVKGQKLPVSAPKAPATFHALTTQRGGAPGARFVPTPGTVLHGGHVAQVFTWKGCKLHIEGRPTLRCAHLPWRSSTSHLALAHHHPSSCGPVLCAATRRQRRPCPTTWSCTPRSTASGRWPKPSWRPQPRPPPRRQRAAPRRGRTARAW